MASARVQVWGALGIHRRRREAIMNDQVTIVIADDDEAYRKELLQYLESNNIGQVVGQAATGADAIALCKNLRPKLLITDMVMDGNTGPFVCGALKDCPYTKVIVLSDLDSSTYVNSCYVNGAKGYVLKANREGELPDAVIQVLSGHVFIGSGVTIDSTKTPLPMIKLEGGRGSSQGATKVRKSGAVTLVNAFTSLAAVGTIGFITYELIQKGVTGEAVIVPIIFLLAGIGGYRIKEVTNYVRSRMSSRDYKERDDG